LFVYTPTWFWLGSNVCQSHASDIVHPFERNVIHISVYLCIYLFTCIYIYISINVVYIYIYNDFLWILAF
jgi:hypothetical protein